LRGLPRRRLGDHVDGEREAFALDGLFDRVRTDGASREALRERLAGDVRRVLFERLLELAAGLVGHRDARVEREVALFAGALDAAQGLAGEAGAHELGREARVEDDDMAALARGGEVFLRREADLDLVAGERDLLA